MVTLLDGGIGYELKLRGVEVPSHVDSIWSAKALFSQPDEVIGMHADYISAGAEVLTINNYTVTPQILARENMAHRVEELTGLAVDLAEKACETAGRRPRIAGSLPPLETSYRTDLTVERDEAMESYRRMAAVLAKRVDLIMCETMASSREAVWAATAAAETGKDFWVSWTLQGNRLNTLPSGESLAEAFAALGELQPSAYLVNCCGANFVTAAIPILASLTNLPVGGYANAERVEPGDDHTGAEADAESTQREAAAVLRPDAYGEEVRQWIDAGASIVGGCCGTRPKHIRWIREFLDA